LVRALLGCQDEIADDDNRDWHVIVSGLRTALGVAASRHSSPNASVAGARPLWTLSLAARRFQVPAKSRTFREAMRPVTSAERLQAQTPDPSEPGHLNDGRHQDRPFAKVSDANS
jgi:hypothetical protein